MFLNFSSARVAELADALDLGSSGQPWGFESPLSHHNFQRNAEAVVLLGNWSAALGADGPEVDLTAFASTAEAPLVG